jgi:hypothetical protein
MQGVRVWPQAIMMGVGTLLVVAGVAPAMRRQISNSNSLA